MKFKAQLQPKSFFMLAGVVFLAGMGIVYLTYASLGEQERALQVLKSELKDDKAVQKEMDESKLKINKLKSKLSHLEHGIPEAAYIATMLHELEEFGKKNNLQILSVRPVLADKSKKEGDKTKKSAYEEQNIAVKGRGTYGDAMRFVDALRNFPKIVAVKSFTIVPKDSGKIEPGSPPLEFDIALQAYAFKDSPTVDPDAEGDKTASRTKGVKDES
ncbi:MAG: type 4a pilus biogenesis protein PilO [Armatimonadota bacterium]